MNQLMLLAQLCGDGKNTEDQLRAHGFNDLPAVAGAGTDHLAEILGISMNAARRMVREAERMMGETGEEERKPDVARQEAQAPTPSPPVTLALAGETEAPVKGEGGRERAARQERREDSEVTPAEVRGLRQSEEKGPETGEPASMRPPKPARETASEPSFWSFG